MLAFANRRQPITHLLALIGLFACGKAKPAAPKDAAPVAVVAADAARADSSGGGITIRFAEKRPPGSQLAKRCTFGGDPLTAECSGGGEGLAVGADGSFYLVAGKQVRRYKR